MKASKNEKLSMESDEIPRNVLENDSKVLYYQLLLTL